MTVDISKMDWTPWFYINECPDPIISLDECNLLNIEVGKFVRDDPRHFLAATYLTKLQVYYERFDNQMPICLRKQLLTELINPPRD